VNDKIFVTPHLADVVDARDLSDRRSVQSPAGPSPSRLAVSIAPARSDLPDALASSVTLGGVNFASTREAGRLVHLLGVRVPVNDLPGTFLSYSLN